MSGLWCAALSALIFTYTNAPLLTQAAIPSGLAKAREEFVAATTKADKAAAARLVTDDLAWVDRLGRVRDKKTWLQELEPLRGTSVSTDVRPYRDGAILVATRKNPDGGETRIFQLWVQQANQWKLAAMQGVPVGTLTRPQTTAPSSPLPPNSGATADVKAIEAAIASLEAGNLRSDAKNFAASVTDQFIGVTVNGLASKQSRVEAVAKNQTDPPPSSTVEQISTRVYGDIAVTNRISRSQNGGTATTIVHVRQDGKWLRAGVAFTPRLMK